MFSRRAVLLTISLAMLLTIPSFSEGLKNGVDWRKWSNEKKVDFVEGSLYGVLLGFGLTTIGMEGDCYETIKDGFGMAVAKFVGGIDYSAIVNGIDSFYDDYKNRSVALPLGMEIVLRDLGGAPPEEIEHLKETYRSR